jgi:hypothetical protein
LATKLQPLLGLHKSSVQGLPSLHAKAAPGWQLPAKQLSPLVHRSASSQGFLLALWLQPLWLSQASSVHGLPSLQSVSLPPLHTPWLHTSWPVQTLPSLQGL